MKIQNKRALKNIPTYHAADINYKHFAEIYRGYTGKPYFFTIGTTLTIDDPLRFKKNLLDSL